MKHNPNFPYAMALPDAPLAMPKQQLERHNSVLATLRRKFASLSWF